MELKEYIVKAEKQHGRKELTKALELAHPNNLTDAKAQRRGLPNYACVILARLLGVNPIEVVAANELATEKRQERREIWQSIMNEAEARILAESTNENPKADTAAETETAPAKEPSEKMVVRDRIELPTRGFSVHCSTN